MQNMLCYCNSQKDFSECCEPIISDKTLPTTAEQLMRSRYSAFASANISYLMNSHHPTTRPTKERKEIHKWTKSVQWMGLNIISKKAGEVFDVEGWVEFKATFMENGKIEYIHENSYFVKENRQWYYKSGIQN